MKDPPMLLCLKTEANLGGPKTKHVCNSDGGGLFGFQIFGIQMALEYHTICHLIVNGKSLNVVSISRAHIHLKTFASGYVRAVIVIYASDGSVVQIQSLVTLGITISIH